MADTERKPWETAKTSDEMNKILRPRESDRMSQAGESAKSPSITKHTRGVVEATKPENVSDELDKRNKTIVDRVGGWSRGDSK